jgi:Ni,Fe-hydrogenase I small subunit
MAHSFHVCSLSGFVVCKAALAGGSCAAFGDVPAAAFSVASLVPFAAVQEIKYFHAVGGGCPQMRIEALQECSE